MTDITKCTGQIRIIREALEAINIRKTEFSGGKVYYGCDCPEPRQFAERKQKAFQALAELEQQTEENQC